MKKTQGMIKAVKTAQVPWSNRWGYGPFGAGFGQPLIRQWSYKGAKTFAHIRSFDHGAEDLVVGHPRQTLAGSVSKRPHAQIGDAVGCVHRILGAVGRHSGFEGSMFRLV